MSATATLSAQSVELQSQLRTMGLELEARLRRLASLRAEFSTVIDSDSAESLDSVSRQLTEVAETLSLIEIDGEAIESSADGWRAGD